MNTDMQTGSSKPRGELLQVSPKVGGFSNYVHYSEPTSNNPPVYIPVKSRYNISKDSGGDSPMDIDKYIDRLDKDRRDMENRLREDRQQMEQRITEERRLSEERTEIRTREFEERLEKRFVNIEQRFVNINQHFDRMEQKLENLSADVHKENKETRRWMMGTFFAVAAMVITSIIGIVTIIITIIPFG